MKNFNNKLMNISLEEKKSISISELIYIFAFTIYLINRSFYTTMFNVYMNENLTTLINLLVLSIVLIKFVFFDKFYFNELILIGFLGISVIMCFLMTKQMDIVMVALLIIGAHNISFSKLIKVYFIVTIFIIVIAMIAANKGIIEHIITIRAGKVRYSFGSIYTTNFAAHIFYLALSYFYIRYNKLSIIDSMAFIAIAILVYRYCDARIDTVSILLISSFTIYIVIRRKISKKLNFKMNFIMNKILIYSVPVGAFLSILFTSFYDPYNSFFSTVDKVLSNRLSQGMIGLNNYGISLFGKRVEMRGNGGVGSAVSDYFFIDSSYLYIALKYGIIILIILCVYFYVYNKDNIKRESYLIPLVVLFISINSLVAHHFIDIAYNPFILLIFSLENKNIV